MSLFNRKVEFPGQAVVRIGGVNNAFMVHIEEPDGNVATVYGFLDKAEELRDALNAFIESAE